MEKQDLFDVACRQDVLTGPDAEEVGRWRLAAGEGQGSRARHRRSGRQVSGALPDNSINSLLPLAIAIIPLLGALCVPLAGRVGDSLRNGLVILVTGLVLALSVILFQLSWQGEVVSRFSVGFGELPLFFRVDRLGAVFNLISALIWFLATVFSLSYMTHESRHNRYYFFYLLTLGGCLGVFLTADLFSLFFFFELMSVASYLLVIHTQSDEAMKAGKLFLFLGVGGGLCILAATALIYWFTGTVVLEPMLEKLIVLPARGLIAFLLVIGFGIKAGMVPLHIWLPKAHPVAPAPASALLSGIMIKTGAYGIARVFTVIYTPAAPETSPLWAYTAQMGTVLIWLGIITMSSAAFMALFQSNAKRILAYSSVSQMGYILMGIGACAYLGFEGPMAFGGFSLHVVNHAFFKAGMFMMVGMVYFRTGEIELNRLGGLWRQFPLTAAVFLFAAMGVAGIPGLNGYTSKVLLHHAIVEAYELHDSYALYLAERIFMLTGAMTTCYIARLFSSIFLGKRPDNLEVHGKESWNEKIVFVVIGAAMLFIGTNPFLVLRELIGPLVQSFPFDDYKLNYFLKVNFWDSHDLQGMAAIVAMAAVLFVLGHRYNLFTRKLPYWLSIEYLVYIPLVKVLLFLYTRSGRILEISVDTSYIKSTYLLKYYCVGGRIIEHIADSAIVQSPRLLRYYSACGKILDMAAEGVIVGNLGSLRQAGQRISALENSGSLVFRLWMLLTALLLLIYDRWLFLISSFFHQTKKVVLTVFYFTFSLDYTYKGKFFQIVNTANFEYYLMVFFILLIIILSLQLFL